jgi:WD40 repeat protein
MYNSAVHAVAITNDGSCGLCSDETGMIYLWSVPEGKQTGVFEGHASPVISMAFTADELGHVSASADGVINVWDFQTMELSSTIQGPKGLTAIAVGTSTILVGDDQGRIHIYHFEEPELRGESWPLE